MPADIKVKICGMNAPVAFDTAIAAGADWVGFNFFPPSPRYVTPAQAAALSARSPGGPLRVGLFVDPTPEAIAATLDVVRLDILQLYGAPDLPGAACTLRSADLARGGRRDRRRPARRLATEPTCW